MRTNFSAGPDSFALLEYPDRDEQISSSGLLVLSARCLPLCRKRAAVIAGDGRPVLTTPLRFAADPASCHRITMRAHLLLAIGAVVVACDGGKGGVARHGMVGNPAPKPVVAINPVCPDDVRDYSWARELFPGCPPRPFWWIGTACAASSCPLPCRDVSTDRSRTRPVASRHFYEHGRWTMSERDWSVGKRLGETTAPDEPPPGTKYCTRSGDRGTCDVFRDADGQDQRVTEAEVRYNEAGDPISILLRGQERPNTYEWAKGHQLVRERVPQPGNSYTEYRYSYDERGRLARVASTGWGFTEEAHYDYDANGLVAKIVIDYSHPSRFTFTFEYDVQHRPVHVVWLDEHEGVAPVREEKRYEYDCPAPKPFSEAVPVLEQFRQKACACTDRACSERVMAELERWRSGLADTVTYRNEPDLASGANFQRIDQEIERCRR